MDKVLVAPSILAADWSRFGEQAKSIQDAGADWLHVDVMDGHFVPPITFGPQAVQGLKKSTSLPLDVHLMIESPEKQIDAFALAGANCITVHQEACPHLHRVLHQIHSHGILAGVALNPATPISTIVDVLSDVDLLLVMSVNPGWGGQSYIQHSTQKIAEAAALIKKSGRKIWLEVDGGIDAKTAPEATSAGANVLVAGTAVFQAKDYKAAISSLRPS